ncbi:hypothetical protein CNR22_09610 [Sphingobacteriaceae bacterium]|nr:hypothetical protein CNR22_09610 [Sphingobacteriaceae bacterium]
MEKESLLKLFMVMIGCRPKGRLTEQHDIFFGIAESMKELIPHMNAFWPEAKGNIHVDAYREVTFVNGYSIKVLPKTNEKKNASPENLFFLNLGGYKVNEFEEFHYKVLAVSETSGEAIQQAKQTAFYKHFGFKGATSHIDDKYGVDVDNIYRITDILNSFFKERYSLQITKEESPEDLLHIGYFPLKKLT